MPTILIVEDNSDSAKTLAMILRYWGYDAIISPTGADALNMVAVQPPQVILLDIGLPDIPGLALAKMLRLHVPQAWVISLSGRDVEQEELSWAEIDHHLVKPADTTELRKALEKCVESPRQKLKVPSPYLRRFEPSLS